MKMKYLSVGLMLGLSPLFSNPASAISVDLVGGDSGSANGALFQWVDQHSVGTGVIEPFLRIQANGTEEGYNSSVAIGNLFGDTKGGLWTHDLMLGDVPIVNVNGTDYYEFLLDINEEASQPLISLYEIEIYTSAGPITAAAGNGKLAYSDLGSDAVKKWDLDVGADGDSVVELDFSRNPGSGWGDMLMYVPVSVLGTDGSQYLTLYSAFGIGNDTGDGFEEWAIRERTEPPGVPDASSTLMLLGLALVGLGGLRKRFNA